MKPVFSIVTLFFFLHAGLYAQSPKREMRAVWLTSYYALDWPNKPFKNSEDINDQQEELIDILDKLKDANLNTVFLQTRLRGDVIYNSQIETVSPYIQGVKNTWSKYDPLAFAVSECHKRGLECHAWFVTYPLGPEKIKGKENNSPIINKYKNKIKRYKREFYMDPGDPETNVYLISIIKEIVENYDIDGIHMDYIRYPDDKFPDHTTYKRYGRGENKDDWRRKNINRFVSEVYETVKSKKPWVQVSSSVVGTYTKMQNSGKQNYLTAYDHVFQDPIKWIQEGKLDFVVPMMYYATDLFFASVLDWKTRNKERYVVPGLGVYLLDEKKTNWSVNKIKEQIRYSRENQMGGNAFFRARYLSNNKKGILDEIKDSFYRHPALLPPLTWLDTIQPAPPVDLKAMITGMYLFLSWESAKQPDDKKVSYNVYRSETWPVDLNSVDNLVTAHVSDRMFFIPLNDPTETGYYYVVTSYDRYHNESIASHPVYFVSSHLKR
jgi:uncharacterized lipoprotein YddW (UPF0748 family)